MTEAVDTSKEAVKRYYPDIHDEFAFMDEDCQGAWVTYKDYARLQSDLDHALSRERALRYSEQEARDYLKERDQLRREVEGARSVRGAAQVLMTACPNPIFDKLKPVLMGEFSQHYPFIDEDGDEVYAKVNVSWTVTKDIIKAALNYLATGSRP